mgnify:CR=1 FL=1
MLPIFLSLVDLSVTFLSFLSPKNAFLPIFLRPLALITTVFNFLQLANALLPIVLTFFPIVAFVIFAFFLNAFLATEVTLYLTPSIVTVAATLTALRDFFLSPVI